ncbi:MAG TPA: hypothetical protein VIM30_16365 [Candidatus Limnocylindrales bacterium]|jgi:hypothetical protein
MNGVADSACGTDRRLFVCQKVLSSPDDPPSWDYQGVTGIDLYRHGWGEGTVVVHVAGRAGRKDPKIIVMQPNLDRAAEAVAVLRRLIHSGGAASQPQGPHIGRNTGAYDELRSATNGWSMAVIVRSYPSDLAGNSRRRSEGVRLAEHGYAAVSVVDDPGKVRTKSLLMTGGFGAAVRFALGKRALREIGLRTVTYQKVT